MQGITSHKIGLASVAEDDEPSLSSLETWVARSECTLKGSFSLMQLSRSLLSTGVWTAATAAATMMSAWTDQHK